MKRKAKLWLLWAFAMYCLASYEVSYPMPFAFIIAAVAFLAGSMSVAVAYHADYHEKSSRKWRGF